jgi:DNA-binding transcriptional LysR family regulator
MFRASKIEVDQISIQQYLSIIDIVPTDIRKIDLNLLVAFKVLLDERNVSRAAERLALTQPTVSGMLARLRVLFDDPLFVRTRHGVIPTPRAESLAPALSQLLSDAGNLIAPEQLDPATMATDFRISVNDYMQSTLVVPFVQALRREAPGVRLAVRHLEIEDLSPMLARGEIDLAITIPEFSAPNLKTEFLYREEYVCVVRKSHAIRSPAVSMKRFLAFDHVLVSPASAHFAGPTDEVLAARGFKRRVVLSVPSFLVLLEVLQSDDLIAFIPGRLFEGHRQNLRAIRPPVEVPGFDVIAAWHPRSEHYAAHRWLRNRLAEQARESS